LSWEETLLPSTRRAFVKGLVASTGTLVLGFDPVRRSWVTSAYADAPTITIPNLDGVLLTDPATLTTYGDDFGHVVHHVPVAVLKPGSVQDVVRAVRFCLEHRIHVAARGLGHSTGGQSQVQGGLVIDSTTLDAIATIGADRVHVQAGVKWIDLIAKTIPLGLMPPVLTGFTGLSIGGTLSMGGVGPASFLHGAQVDNVIELEVVTGEGLLVACSADNHTALFDAVRGGVGQYGIIVGATLPLLAVAPTARSYVVTYLDAPTFFGDMNVVTGGRQADGVYGLIAPNPSGGWVYQLNLVKYFADGSPPDDSKVLAGLHFPPPALQTSDADTFSTATSVDQLFAFLQSVGLYDIPHVWGDVFLPGSRTESFVSSSLENFTAADLGPAGFILLFPVRNIVSQQLAFRLPLEPTAFLFDVLTSGLPTDTSYASTELAKARTLFETARTAGGTVYPIGSIPLLMSKLDWVRQYGPLYVPLQIAKEAFDPAHILTPGPGIF
jgi:FAD/FMN-containing dehydrogenase